MADSPKSNLLLEPNPPHWPFAIAAVVGLAFGLAVSLLGVLLTR
jgi:hypothetical protein